MPKFNPARITPSVKQVIKYGPWVAQAIKYGHEPVQKAAAAAMDNHTNRKTAIEHATTVTDGTVLAAFDQGRRSWVVFSGDIPVAAYPATGRALTEIVEHSDLDKRLTPDDLRAQQRVQAIRRARDKARNRLPHRRS